MRTALILAAIVAAAPAVMPTAAIAQENGWHRDNDPDRGDDHSRHDDRGRGDYNWRGDRNEGGWDPSRSYHNGNYQERRLGRNDRIYRGGDGRYYCRRNDGTTGLVIGALAGGLLGNAIGGNTLGALLGGGGGAILGRSVDRGNIRCR